MNQFLLLTSANLDVNGSTLDSLSKLFKDHGIISIALVSLFGVLLYMGFKYFNYWISSERREHIDRIDDLTKTLTDLVKAKDDKYGTSPTPTSVDVKILKDLINHPLFYNIDYTLKVKINDVNLSTETKKNIFKDYITVKYSCIRTGWSEFLDEDISIWSRDVLKRKIVDKFIDINITCEKRLSLLEIPEFIQTDLNKSIYPADKFMFSLVENITSSNFYDNNDEVIYTVFNTIMILIDLVYYDAINNLEKLNGRTDSIVYKPYYNH